MRTMLPDDAVRQRMQADGASPADFDFVFGSAIANAAAGSDGVGGVAVPIVPTAPSGVAEIPDGISKSAMKQ